MSRPGKAVIVYDGKEKLKFKSLNKAAEYYDVPYISLYHCMRRGNNRYTPLNLSFEFASEDDTKPFETSIRARRDKEPNSLVVEIDGEKYYSVSAEDKTNCEDCDIFKAKKPRYMTDYPLCYIYFLHNHKIVDYCRSKRIIWQKEK